MARKRTFATNTRMGAAHNEVITTDGKLSATLTLPRLKQRDQKEDRQRANAHRCSLGGLCQFHGIHEPQKRNAKGHFEKRQPKPAPKVAKAPPTLRPHPYRRGSRGGPRPMRRHGHRLLDKEQCHTIPREEALRCVALALDDSQRETSEVRVIAAATLFAAIAGGGYTGTIGHIGGGLPGVRRRDDPEGEAEPG